MREFLTVSGYYYLGRNNIRSKMYDKIVIRLKGWKMFMIKKFLLLFLCILISNAAVFADNSVLVKTADDVIQVRTAEMTDKIKNQRSDIYNSLNLTSEQIVKIKEIDNDFYKNIEPKLKRMVFLTKKNRIHRIQ